MAGIFDGLRSPEDRMWQPEDHPKAKAGTTIGGQFVKAGSSAPTQAAKPAAKPAAAKAPNRSCANSRPRKPSHPACPAREEPT